MTLRPSNSTEGKSARRELSLSFLAAWSCAYPGTKEIKQAITVIITPGLRLSTSSPTVTPAFSATVGEGSHHGFVAIGAGSCAVVPLR